MKNETGNSTNVASSKSNSSGFLNIAGLVDDPAFKALREGERSGLGSTLLLVRMRWRMIRSVGFKFGILIILGLFVVGLFSSVNLGYLVQLTAQQGTDTAQTIYATAWVSALDSGYIASFGALAIGGAVLVAFFAPLTGTSTLSLLASDDSLGLRPNKMHRFWDSLLINTTSGIGLLQFVTLTAVSSLITIDGNRFWALTFTWVLWFALVCTNTTLGFVFEFFQRKWGPKQKRIIGAALLSVLAVAVLLDDKRGTDLFGLADYYNKGLRLSVESFNWNSLTIIGATLLLVFLLILAGIRVAGIAFSLPERNSSRGGVYKSTYFGKRPFMIASLFIARSLVRTKEARKPVLTILILGIPVALFVPLDETLIVAFTMTVPLALSLGWAVNIFGLLGQGMYWLSAQPKIMYFLPRASFLFQVLLTALFLLGFWVIGYYRGNINVESSQVLMVGAIINGISTAALSSLLSISHPVRAALKNRGDALVPPLTALAYLVIIVTFGCLPGIFVTQQESENAQLWLTLGITSFFLILTYVSWKFWDRPKERAKVTSIVAVE